MHQTGNYPDRFDWIVGLFIAALLIVTGIVILRGDQIGIGVQRFTPQASASSRAAIRITFDEPIDQPSAESRLTILPAVRGKLSVTQNQLTFVPEQPLTQGQAYTVTLRAGVQGRTGRVLKQDIQWQFRVTPPRVVYLGPVNNIVQNIYRIDPAQAQPSQQLTQSPKGVLTYDAAPDGSGVIYTQMEPAGTSSLYWWDAATGQTRLFYECQDAACSSPVWRPDGGAIAFERVNLNSGTGIAPGAPRVWVLDVAANAARPLFNDSQQLGYMPRWSPDGNRLAVINANAGGIVVHDFTTNTDTLISTVSGEMGTFSPDGKWLSFPKVVAQTNQRFVTHLVLVDVSGDLFIQHDLIPDSDPNDDVEAAWLPDSKRLIVSRRSPTEPRADNTQPTTISGAQLYMVDAASGKAEPLVINAVYDHKNVTLAPDGNTALFLRYPLDKPGASPEIWTINLTTRELKLVAVNGVAPRWLP
ncbi:MAG: PD40 domain-containing protein [Anaerolineae bacterium]|nr:PD40 domain-containing protein [Anaerolineae bacterium]